jgi:hypothetical protein
VTTLNLKVRQTDVERGLILVEGAVPGVKGGWITVRDAVKKKLPDGVPKPGKFKLAEAASDAKDGTHDAAKGSAKESAAKESIKESANPAAAGAKPEAVKAEAATAAPAAQAAAKPDAGKKPKKGE